MRGFRSNQLIAHAKLVYQGERPDADSGSSLLLGIVLAQSGFYALQAVLNRTDSV